MRKTVFLFLVLALTMAWFGRDGVRAQTQIGDKQLKGGVAGPPGKDGLVRMQFMPTQLNCLAPLKCTYDPAANVITIQLLAP